MTTPRQRIVQYLSENTEFISNFKAAEARYADHIKTDFPENTARLAIEDQLDDVENKNRRLDEERDSIRSEKKGLLNKLHLIILSIEYDLMKNPATKDYANLFNNVQDKVFFKKIAKQDFDVDLALQERKKLFGFLGTTGIEFNYLEELKKRSPDAHEKIFKNPEVRAICESLAICEQSLKKIADMHLEYGTERQALRMQHQRVVGEIEKQVGLDQSREELNKFLITLYKDNIRDAALNALLSYHFITPDERMHEKYGVYFVEKDPREVFYISGVGTKIQLDINQEQLQSLYDWVKQNPDPKEPDGRIYQIYLDQFRKHCADVLMTNTKNPHEIVENSLRAGRQVVMDILANPTLYSFALNQFDKATAGKVPENLLQEIHHVDLSEFKNKDQLEKHLTQLLQESTSLKIPAKAIEKLAHQTYNQAQYRKLLDPAVEKEIHPMLHIKGKKSTFELFCNTKEKVEKINKLLKKIEKGEVKEAQAINELNGLLKACNINLKSEVVERIVQDRVSLHVGLLAGKEALKAAATGNQLAAPLSPVPAMVAISAPKNDIQPDVLVPQKSVRL